jgi:hypothetical protein
MIQRYRGTDRFFAILATTSAFGQTWISHGFDAAVAAALWMCAGIGILLVAMSYRFKNNKDEN